MTEAKDKDESTPESKLILESTERDRKVGESPWAIAAAVVFVLFLWWSWTAYLSHWTRERFENPIGIKVTSSQSASQRPASEGVIRVQIEAESPKPAAGKVSKIDGYPIHATGTVRIELPTQSNEESMLSGLGLAGDSFGGFNALAAALACLGVFWAAMLQRKTLIETRAAYNKDQTARSYSQTEAIFFELLKLSRELAERVVKKQSRKISDGLSMSSAAPDTEASSQEYLSGPAALDAIAYTIYVKNRHTAKTELVKKSISKYASFYDQQPSRIGPYFRLLFQIFQLLSEAPITPAQRLRLSKIARGQLSEGMVLLLALNALTWRGKKFVNFIQDYGLLEHMHPRYLRLYREPLRQVFDNHAFLGSEERAMSERYVDGQKPDPNKFDAPEEVGREKG